MRCCLTTHSHSPCLPAGAILMQLGCTIIMLLVAYAWHINMQVYTHRHDLQVLLATLQQCKQEHEKDKDKILRLEAQLQRSSSRCADKEEQVGRM